MKDFETVDLKKSRVKFNISMGLLGMFGYSLSFFIQCYELTKFQYSFWRFIWMSAVTVFFVISVKVFSKNVDRLTSGKYK